MPNVLAYILDDPAIPFERREKTMRDYAAKHLLGLEFYFFMDDAADGSIPLRRRPAGNWLIIHWRIGDHLIFDSSLAFGSERDFRHFLIWTQGCRVTVHLMDLGFISSDKRALELIIHVLGLVEKRRSVSSKKAHKRLRARGCGSNQHCKPGFRMVRRAGRLVRERDEDAWSDIERIVGLRKDGLSWQQTSDSMFELECQRMGKQPKFMAPRKWTVWRCREAVKVWEQPWAGKLDDGDENPS